MKYKSVKRGSKLWTESRINLLEEVIDELKTDLENETDEYRIQYLQDLIKEKELLLEEYNTDGIVIKPYSTDETSNIY